MPRMHATRSIRSPRLLGRLPTSLFLVGLAVSGTATPLRAIQGGAPGTPAPPRPELCRQVQPELDRRIARHRVDDPARLARIRGLVSRLQAAAARPGLRLDVILMGMDEMNAFATPCDQILVTVPMLEWLDEVAAGRSADRPEASTEELADAYLAAILGHELAHITLGHTGALMEEPLAALGRADGEAAEAGEAEGDADDPAAGERAGEERALPGADVARARDSQEVELEADRAGALYLLRAGWEIQHAMDFHRALDRLVREEGCVYCLAATSYLSSHPRPSTREAALEGYRAELKLHQTRYDDALSLITHNVELDLAIRLLDEVLRDFPDLGDARHAQAVAHHLKWLNTAPVQGLRVRASVPTYGARFLPGIRGGAGDLQLLDRARRAYERVLAREEFPYSVSNLAVLEAYAGRAASARYRARRAAEVEPEDPAVLNNLGVVRYVTGEYEEAREAFERALETEEGADNPPLVFNLGVTLRELGRPEATRWLLRYLEEDSGSSWARLARTMVRGRGAEPTASEVPAPALAGIPLRASPDSVETLLDREADRKLDTGLQLVWDYRDEGLLVAIDRREGVTFVKLRKAGAPGVYGVRVGDPVASLAERLSATWGGAGGDQVGTRDFSSLGDDLRLFHPGPEAGWVLSVGDRDGTISSLAVSRLP